MEDKSIASQLLLGFPDSQQHSVEDKIYCLQNVGDDACGYYYRNIEK